MSLPPPDPVDRVLISYYSLVSSRLVVIAALQLIRRLSPSRLLRRLRDDLWSTKHFFELRCDLSKPLPEVAPAKLPITMTPVPPRTFRGFRDELTRTDAENYLKVLLRTWYCRAGVETLYVAFDGEKAAYAQWLVTAEGQRRIPRFLPGRFPALDPNDRLVEGAYTFLDYRRLGLMRDGMAQLLRFAADAGAAAVITYVADDNIGSLRGCANVGFTPHRVRVSTRRIVRWARNHPVDDKQLAVWQAATARDERATPAEAPARQAEHSGG